MSSTLFSPSAIHFIAYFFIQKFIIGLLLAFTEPGSIIRAAPLPALIFYNYHLLPIYSIHISRSTWLAFIAGQNLGIPLEYLEKLLLSRWNFKHHGPEMETGTAIKGTAQVEKKHAAQTTTSSSSGRALDVKKRESSSAWNRLRFGFWVALSNRYIASPYQARNSPPYSASDPNYIPSKINFLLRRISVFLICYLILDLLLLGNQPTLNPILYAQEHVPFFPRLLNHDISVEEIFTRVASGLGFWAGAYLMVQGWFSAIGVVAVVTGLSSPKNQRPVFGSLKDAYSIRRFWGSFWHQLMRKKLTVSATYISSQLLHPLHLPHQFYTIASCYTELILAFLMSGIIHQLVEVACGMGWGESGAVEFFLIMAVGIMAEDLMIWGWRKGTGRGGVRNESLQDVPRWQKTIGYIWVILFFSWVTPTWAYPTMRRNVGGPESFPLPFSIIGLIKL